MCTCKYVYIQTLTFFFKTQATTSFAKGKINLGAALVSANILRKSNLRFVIRHTQDWSQRNMSLTDMQQAVMDADGFMFRSIAQQSNNRSILRKWLHANTRHTPTRIPHTRTLMHTPRASTHIILLFLFSIFREPFCLFL